MIGLGLAQKWHMYRELPDEYVRIRARATQANGALLDLRTDQGHLRDSPLGDWARSYRGGLILEAVRRGGGTHKEGHGNGAAHDPTRVAAPEDPFGLTPRERQVLQLLAQGATNRQIGQALYMAEKTASVHVSRILSKLDVQGRTEAAAVAHRLHLT